MIPLSGGTNCLTNHTFISFMVCQQNIFRWSTKFLSFLDYNTSVLLILYFVNFALHSSESPGPSFRVGQIFVHFHSHIFILIPFRTYNCNQKVSIFRSIYRFLGNSKYASWLNLGFQVPEINPAILQLSFSPISGGTNSAQETVLTRQFFSYKPDSSFPLRTCHELTFPPKT